MFNLGVSEMIVIGIVALFVFGPGRLPEVSRALGKSVREFRKAMHTVTEAVEDEPAKQGDSDGRKTR